MTVRVALNGFGRIGRMVFRAAVEAKRSDIEFVAINDLGPAESNAHLLRWDSVHGPLPAEVSVAGDLMTVDVKSGRVHLLVAGFSGVRYFTKISTGPWTSQALSSSPAGVAVIRQDQARASPRPRSPFGSPGRISAGCSLARNRSKRIAYQAAQPEDKLGT